MRFFYVQKFVVLDEQCLIDFQLINLRFFSRLRNDQRWKRIILIIVEVRRVSTVSFEFQKGFLTKAPNVWEFLPFSDLANAIKNVKNKPFNLAKYVNYGESDTSAIIEIKIFFIADLPLNYVTGKHINGFVLPTLISISSISTSILIGVNTKSNILIVKIRFNIIRFVRNFDITR